MLSEHVCIDEESRGCISLIAASPNKVSTITTKNYIDDDNFQNFHVAANKRFRVCRN